MPKYENKYVNIGQNEKLILVRQTNILIDVLEVLKRIATHLDHELLDWDDDENDEN